MIDFTENKKSRLTIEELKQAVREFAESGVPVCPICKIKMIKIEEESNKFCSVWKTGCSCIKATIRLYVG